MGIEDLQKKLYKPGADFEGRPEAPEAFEVGRGEKYQRAEQRWSEINGRPTQKWQFGAEQKKNTKQLLLALGIVVILVAGFLIWRQFFSFDRDRVLLKIVGPQRIVSGEEITYAVQYQNNSALLLNGVNLVFELPEGGAFADGPSGESRKTISLANLAAKSGGQADVRVQIMGVKDNQRTVTAKLSYRPGSLKTNFDNKAELTSTIISVPLVLDFDLPKKVVDNQLVKLVLRYLNTSEAIFSDLQLKIDYPNGFSFDSAYPPPTEDKNIWAIDRVSGREEGKITISGLLSGRQDENKSFKAQLGLVRNGKFIALAEAIDASQLSVPPLNVSQMINGQEKYDANPGEALNFIIKYQNTTDVGIKGVTITARLGGEAIDFSTVQSENGFFNSTSKTVNWNASTLRKLEFLAPHAEGETKFSLKVKDKSKLPISDFGDKNFIVLTKVMIDSSDVPLSLTGTQIGSEHKLETKINSALGLLTKGYFRDEKFTNTGPLPPKVGEMTTYTIYWYLSNTSNELDNVQVRTYLPTYIHWTDEYEPKNMNVRYEPNTGRLTWEVGQLPAAVGILSPIKYLAFKIGLVPSASQVGKLVNLINESRVEGHDVFTDANLTSTAQLINSELPDDSTIGYEQGKVSQ